MQPILTRYVATWLSVYVTEPEIHTLGIRARALSSGTDAFTVHKTKRHESTTASSIGLRACVHRPVASFPLESTAGRPTKRFLCHRVTLPAITSLSKSSGIVAHLRKFMAVPPSAEELENGGRH